MAARFDQSHNTTRHLWHHSDHHQASILFPVAEDLVAVVPVVVQVRWKVGDPAEDRRRLRPSPWPWKRRNQCQQCFAGKCLAALRYYSTPLHHRKAICTVALRSGRHKSDGDYGLTYSRKREARWHHSVTRWINYFDNSMDWKWYWTICTGCVQPKCDQHWFSATVAWCCHLVI